MESTTADVVAACVAAERAAADLAELPLARRSALLTAVADALAADGAALIALADAETALGVEPLRAELARTTAQLRLLADEVLRGDFLQARDEGAVQRVLVPIGPVAVYAASNFPFALSVAGSDTASALAAGCPVVVKAHPGHPRTSRRTEEVVAEALAGAPRGCFSVVHGFTAGSALITDPRIKAAAFTGSQAGGRALFDAAAARPDPIPFYGELGSVNPVFVTRAAIEARGAEIVAGFAGSLSRYNGQLCTSPGLLLLPEGHGLTGELAAAVAALPVAPMLNERIAHGYREGVTRLSTVATRLAGAGAGPQLFQASAADFHGHPELREECFGPASVIVEYRGEDELLALAAAVPGSLTATIHAEPGDTVLARRLVRVLSRRAGRLVWNDWPTGVAVNRATNHGGPWPATTNPLHTSIGTEAVRRFQVPVAVQGVPAEVLPVPGAARHVRDGGPYTWIAPTERPLDGFTLAVKELFAVAGRPLGAGSAARATADPEPTTAEVVTRLVDAGARLVGTTALHEFAFGVTGINHHTGTPVNPSAPGRIPGGSSSGSAAAVADGSARIALATDTGGSVRIPAALCGVVGFKPSHGRYPATGVFPLSPTLDHVGVHARTVADVCRVHRALGHSVSDAPDVLRLGVLTREVEHADTPVREATRAALERLAAAGHKLVDITELPAPEAVLGTSNTIMFFEAAAVHRESLRANAVGYGRDVHDRLVAGAAIAPEDYQRALRHRERVATQVRALFADVDALIGPTVGLLAPPMSVAAEDTALPARLVANTRLANLTGSPAISLPLPGADAPVGLQLTGTSDADLLGHAALVAAVLGQR